MVAVRLVVDKDRITASRSAGRTLARGLPQLAGGAVVTLAVLFTAVTAFAGELCPGDCNADGAVTVDELIRGSNMARGKLGRPICRVFAADSDPKVSADAVIGAVNRALSGCPAGPPPVWYPAVTYPSLPQAGPRGFLDRRGLIHAHSVYSHDACDNMPVKNGVRDPVCFDDFRRGLCQSKHDFVMLTDHTTSFAEYEYPEVLLYRPERGDRLVQRDGKPVASWAGCPDGSHALILAGNEGADMPVGLEEHVADPADRRGIYDSSTPEALEAMRAKEAVVLVAHTENWTVDQLQNLPLDGFEMYNLHANLIANVGPALQLLLRLTPLDLGFPHPDLILLDFINEDSRYLTRWGTVLASGVKRVTTMATDCHRNSFPQLLPDGERGDSYRRMMSWFSNHLLIRPETDGSWDDRHLKDALRSSRLYGAFEVMGYPEGFDYHAEVGGTAAEMGEEVQLTDHPFLSVTPPSVRNLNPNRTPPVLTVRILRAVQNGFEEVASGPATISFTPTLPGAYRAEVRMVPLHLREDLGSDANKLLAKDFVWIYSNPIYVR